MYQGIKLRELGSGMQEFEITSEYIEMNKLLKATGLCATGGEAKHLIIGGQVKVDGEVETRIRCKIKKDMLGELGSEQVKVVSEATS